MDEWDVHVELMWYRSGGSIEKFQMCPFTRSFALLLNLAPLECCKYFFDKYERDFCC